MFYCDECRTARDYPESFSKSKGKCEICGRTALCHDKPVKEIMNKTQCKVIKRYKVNNSINIPLVDGRSIAPNIGDPIYIIDESEEAKVYVIDWEIEKDGFVECAISPAFVNLNDKIFVKEI